MRHSRFPARATGVNLRITPELWHPVRMRIVCPSCQAAYDVPDSLVLPGRIVRCARCSTEWVALTVEAPEQDEPEPESFSDARDQPELDSPRLSAMDRLAQPVRLRALRGSGLRAAWIASIVLLLALGWAAYAWRSNVMHAWPASIRLYSALGLSVPPPR